ncbi:hypothetical protein [Actinophytocola sp.]|jgi:hypothetical protein|uniref:hypothetical protein n=1 Tax=Actinophytocola sp. TaxID=1872138 RepID=UPI002ED82CA8
MTEDGHRLLAALRDAAPETPSTVDVGRAVRVGRRRRRTRQLTGVVVVAAVTAIVAAVIPALVGRPLPPAHPLGEFDLMRQELSVGSAGGFTPVSYETGRYVQRVLLVPVDESAPRASVSAYATGRLPDFEGARWEPDGAQAPDVNDHRAYWVSGRDAVAWEWAPGAWAFAEVTGAGEDGRRLAHRVAQSVARHPGRVTLPFAVPDLPAPYRLVGVRTPYGTSSDPAAGALLVLDAGGTRVRLGVRRHLDRDFVTGDRRSTPVANTDVGGRAAAVRDNSVTIFDPSPAVVAEADGPAPDLVALATSVRPG